jgi:hypothetical protein
VNGALSRTVLYATALRERRCPHRLDPVNAPSGVHARCRQEQLAVVSRQTVQEAQSAEGPCVLQHHCPRFLRQCAPSIVSSASSRPSAIKMFSRMLAVALLNLQSKAMHVSTWASLKAWPSSAFSKSSCSGPLPSVTGCIAFTVAIQHCTNEETVILTVCLIVPEYSMATASRATAASSTPRNNYSKVQSPKQMEAPPQSLHVALARLCSQMEVPPQSLQSLLWWLCSQMEVPPQSLHWPITLLCSQMESTPQSLHWALCLLCSQMEVPPQSLHCPLTWLCLQMEVPPQSLQMLLWWLCSQMESSPQSLHVLLCQLCSQMEAPPQSLHWPLTRLC